MKKADVLEFKLNLEDNLFQLHRELKNKTYQHSNYTSFTVCDPKLRRIHKANVRDRILHHAIFRVLYPIFDKGFIFDSYSCRIGKGTHRAVTRLEKLCRKLSRNNSRNIFALKCDIRKFFDSVNQNILLEIIRRKVKNEDTMRLVENIVRSFEARKKKGLPLGNVTSQLFANIYLNEFDQFAKHKVKVKYYIRYCDDLVILSEVKKWLENIVFPIKIFLGEKLKLELHPDKVFIKTLASGMDFLGMVNFFDHRILRTATKRRMLRKIREKKFLLREGLISEESFDQSLQSYLGMLTHCAGYKIKSRIEDIAQISL